MNEPGSNRLSRRARANSIVLSCALTIAMTLALATTASAGVITSWSGMQPTGTVGTGAAVTIQGSGPWSAYPLLPSTAKLYLDGFQLAPGTFTASVSASRLYFYCVPRPVLSDGAHTFRVEVSDGAGTLSSKQWSANVAQPPTATWKAPSAGSVLYTGSPRIVLAVSDNTASSAFTVTGQVHTGSAAGPVVATFGGTGLPAGELAFTPSAEVPPGAVFVTASVADASGNTRFLLGTAARAFTAAVAPAMSVLSSCDACHAPVRAAHPTPSSTECGVCHPDKTGAHMQGTDYCEDCHWQGWHTGGQGQVVAVRSSCDSCHNPSRPGVVQHNAATAEGTHGSSCGACHAESLIARHAQVSASAYTDQCDLCHASTDPTVVAAIAASDTTCDACHSGDVASLHPGFGSAHTYSDLAPGCQGARCHSAELTPTHQAFVGTGQRYPQYADTCELCHANEAVGRIPSDATAACVSCHPNADHEALHAVREDCAGCHGSSLTTLHAVIGCDGCHASVAPAVAAAIAAGNTECGACHLTAPHPNLVTLHASTVTAGSVQVFGYHEGISPAESWAECTMCHASTNLLDAHGYGCATCHNGTKPADSFVTWNKGCQQGSCHTPYNHPSGDSGHQGYGCDCHDTYTCDDCHNQATAAPVTTSDVKGSYVGSATISMSAGNLTWTYYRLDGGATRNGTTVVVAGPGSGVQTHVIEYWSVNDAGLAETHQAVSFTISADVTPPTTTSDAADSYIGPATITFMVTDDNSTPVGDTFWVLDTGGPNNGSVAIVAQPPGGTQSHTLEYWSVDVAGNEETPHHSVTFTITNDSAPPVGTVLINGGAAYTTSSYVNLTLSASDVGGSGVSEMRFSKDNVTWSAWEPYATSKNSWQMGPAQGARTAYVQFKDVAGNVCAVSDSIVYDSVAPTGTFSINGGAAGTVSSAVTVNMAMTDAVSGVTSMRFTNDSYVSSWTTWTSWEPYSATKAWVLAAGNGERWVQAQFIDAAGNTVTCSDRIVASIGDTTPPTGTLSIAGGALATNTRSVYLYTDATDTGGVGWVYQMQFSTDGLAWTAWENYSGAKAWTLDVGDGTKTIYARYNDYSGNVSPIYSDTIVLDQTAPAGSVVIAGGADTVGSSIVSLTVSAADGGGSGLTEMQFSNDAISWSAWEAYATAKSWTLLPGNGDKTVFVRFRDGAGNVGGPWQDTVTLATSDVTPPSGTVVINGGALSTPTRSVTLTVAATDAGGSGVAQMQFSNDNVNWSTWETYATTKPWTLISGNGGKSVYVRFMDGAGNVSGTSSDAITLAITTASLRFEWPAGSGWADLSVKNASGTIIASTQVWGDGADLTWEVTVTAGQSYQLLVDQIEDYATDDAFTNYAAIWSYDTRINPDGILSPEETVIWSYR